MDPYLNDWLNLLIRWLHVIAGIAWIGSSFYFVMLDNSLLPPKDERDAEKGVRGEFWAVHGGGFYHVQKYRVAPATLPEPLHWFKWEAYTTWLSGFALLVVLYYVNAETYLIDRQVADISAPLAIGISVGILAGGWVVYDVLCRVLGRRSELALALALIAFTAAVAYGTSQVFSGRAMYIQVGAMLGTMMAGNVLFNIIPAHWELVRAKQAGREPDPAPGIGAKQRSVHNNYLTLPVVFTMIANHFPFTYGSRHAWLILLALALIGALVRHFFNLRHRGITSWPVPVAASLAIVALALAIRPDTGGSGGAPAADDPVPFSEVQAVVEQRCAVCHSSEPAQGGSAPKGVRFDTPEQIAAQAALIDQQAVKTHAMPPGNTTGMTDEERDLLGAWVRQGAKTE